MLNSSLPVLPSEQGLAEIIEIRVKQYPKYYSVIQNSTMYGIESHCKGQRRYLSNMVKAFGVAACLKIRVSRETFQAFC